MEEKRALLEELQRREGLRYAPELRRRVMAYVERARAQGMSWSRLSGELGIPAHTLSRWGSEPSDGGGFVSVRTPQSQGKGTITLVSPQGWRLEGLDTQTAVTLLRSLAA